MCETFSNEMPQEGLSFAEQLLEYLNKQLELEEADIEAHKLLTNEEKIEQGLLIAGLALESIIRPGEYELRVGVDNTKLKPGNSVVISTNFGKEKGVITDMSMGSISVRTVMDLAAAETIDVEIAEAVYVESMISLMSMIAEGKKPGMAYLDTIEGLRQPTARGIGALPEPRWNSMDGFNEMQKLVIKEAICRPSIYCIQGPPGTGKTSVLSQIAHEFIIKGKDVLLLANTHQAVNNAINRCCADIPNVFACKFGGSLTAELHPGAHAYSNYADYSNAYKTFKSHHRNSGALVGMTLHSAVVNIGLRPKNPLRPQIVLVDEASQIPLAYAALIGSFGCGSVIFIGDDKQMPPIFHPSLADHPFSTSVFQYLCDKHPSLRKMLNITYRMNDEITDVVGKCFYDSKDGSLYLESSEYSASKRANFKDLKGVMNDSLLGKALLSEESIVFVDPSVGSVDGLECQDSNIHEAELAAEIVKIFDINGISPSKYAIITPYRRQVRLIRSLVCEEYDDNSPLIDTVECLQGQDVDTIIISFAVTDSHYMIDQLSFLLNPNRLNVMISRAKTKVILLMSGLLRQALYSQYGSTLASCSGIRIIE